MIFVPILEISAGLWPFLILPVSVALLAAIGASSHSRNQDVDGPRRVLKGRRFRRSTDSQLLSSPFDLDGKAE